jgi:HAD superfamily hydrolase (TIGR01509 family)
MIEALLFDLGKVLVDFDFERGMQRFAAKTSLTREQFEQVIWDKHWIRRYERGEISTGEYLAHLNERGKLNMTLDEFHEAWSAVFLPDLILPEQLLINLKKNYPLILVSNTNESHASFVSKRYSVFDHFGHRILSHEVGSLKPDLKIYRAAIEASGKPASALFFVDDREENIEAALSLGIQAHLFRTPAGLFQAFKQHGIEPGEL